jgi:hypothetical protein
MTIRETTPNPRKIRFRHTAPPPTSIEGFWLALNTVFHLQ